MTLSPTVSYAAPGGALLKEEAKVLGRAFGQAEQAEARTIARGATAGGSTYRRMDDEKKSSWLGKVLIGLIAGSVLWTIAKMAAGPKPRATKTRPSPGPQAPSSSPLPPPLPPIPRKGPPPFPPHPPR